MVSSGIESFKNKRVLILQGPVGPFFKRLAQDLKNNGAEVIKINFNGGDWFFSSEGSIDFRGGAQEWPDFFSTVIKEYWIDTVILFGDCREYHRVAHAIAHAKGIEIGVFEEGYVRPDYITFEPFGVNGFSQLPRNREFYDTLEQDKTVIVETIPVGNTFYYAAWWAILYYLFSALMFPRFRHYRHHRPLNPWQVTYWIRAVWRKWFYKMSESEVQEYLVTQAHKRYFLVPLQISTDAQICEHSSYSSVENFCERVIGSFAAHAPKETLLVIKHHPLDRGYHNYASLIKRMSTVYGVDARVLYIHDQHLPTLLEHALGVVLINSTVGLSALHHSTPLKVCGTAIYDISGLTYQGLLENFWNDAPSFIVDKKLYEKFKGYVINQNQINGSFYRRLDITGSVSGIQW